MFVFLLIVLASFFGIIYGFFIKEGLFWFNKNVFTILFVLMGLSYFIHDEIQKPILSFTAGIFTLTVIISLITLVIKKLVKKMGRKND